MKKTISLLLSLLLLSALFAGCAAQNEDKKEFHVISTIFAPFDFARNLAGENWDETMLLSPGVDIHSFEPTPKDIVAIKNCDLFIYVGGESDAWVESLLASLGSVRTLRLMDCVDVLDEELVEGMDPGEEAEEEADEPDEHVWTSPENAAAITRAISAAMQSIDSVHADEIKTRENNYVNRLETLDARIRGIVEAGKRQTIVFADRFPMRYFTEAYGLSYAAAFPGCASNTEPSAAAVKFLIEKVRTEGIPVVFYTEFSNQKMADTICESTGAKKLRMHSCHNVSREDFDAGLGYIELMTQNADALEEALG